MENWKAKKVSPSGEPTKIFTSQGFVSGGGWQWVTDSKVEEDEKLVFALTVKIPETTTLKQDPV
ncbi:MAG: hypothetical protein ABEJ72_08390, partial [Candidatus Aenigmatarchaeota archaeon]